MKSTILLIDGDQFLFKACVAVEREVRWDEQNHVLYTNAEEAFVNLEGMLSRIFSRFDTEEHALCFTVEPKFRIQIDPTYKGGRDPRKPLCYARLREKLEEKYNCIGFKGLEADDVMGVLATKPNAQRKIIVSQDKDMKTIPATVWDGRDLIETGEHAADFFHMYQTLVGDTSDGYKGCPGVGPKKAEKILGDESLWINKLDLLRPAAWQAVVATFVNAGLTEADALTQARLARILRWTDWDSENKKPILWTPPQGSKSASDAKDAST